ncbi:hypothetical protein BpHYR1_007402 [Brachionus plicatilis]|uniref:Uncharacterized protein n=1 Tax=Brachionus plicatilis TaxID=10195 RepID=A0A3M7PL55_BRAPC|nr:hypothetical protein BpHYR1_007402 [Brachionus plicatilis]
MRHRVQLSLTHLPQVDAHRGLISAQIAKVKTLGLHVKVTRAAAAHKIAAHKQNPFHQRPVLAQHHAPHQLERLVDGAVQVAQLGPQRVVRVGLLELMGPVGLMLAQAARVGREQLVGSGQHCVHPAQMENEVGGRCGRRSVLQSGQVDKVADESVADGRGGLLVSLVPRDALGFDEAEPGRAGEPRRRVQRVEAARVLVELADEPLAERRGSRAAGRSLGYSINDISIEESPTKALRGKNRVYEELCTYETFNEFTKELIDSSIDDNNWTKKNKSMSSSGKSIDNQPAKKKRGRPKTVIEEDGVVQPLKRAKVKVNCIRVNIQNLKL